MWEFFACVRFAAITLVGLFFVGKVKQRQYEGHDHGDDYPGIKPPHPWPVPPAHTPDDAA